MAGLQVETSVSPAIWLWKRLSKEEKRTKGRFRMESDVHALLYSYVESVGAHAVGPVAAAGGAGAPARRVGVAFKRTSIIHDRGQTSNLVAGLHPKA